MFPDPIVIRNANADRIPWNSLGMVADDGFLAFLIHSARLVDLKVVGLRIDVQQCKQPQNDDDKYPLHYYPFNS